MMTQRENILRSVRFERPERIPVVFWINFACRNRYPPAALDDLQESHPYLFPGFRRSSEPPAAPTPPVRSSRVDAWGVTPASPEEGIAAVAVRHPLADWDAPIETEVRTLGSREGGLMTIYGMYPGIPLVNARALMDAMGEYSTYYS
jgi:hypothetical protein